MTHDGKPGVLISYLGHTLTVLEGHGLLFGALGGFAAGFIGEVSDAIEQEPQYVGGGFFVAYVAGRLLRDYVTKTND